MDSGNQALANLAAVLDHFYLRLIGISLIVGGPITVALSQIGLAIREIALSSRKEYSSDEYDSLKWIATIFFYIGWFIVPIGIIFILKSP